MRKVKCLKCGSYDVYTIDSCNENLVDIGCEKCGNKDKTEFVLEDE